MNKKSKIIPFSILTMLLVIGSGVLSSCSTPSTSVDPTTTTTTTTTPVIEVSSVTLDITEVSLEVEATKQLTATVLPATATVKTITWSTSDKAIATVSDAGLVTALKAGTATISAKAGSKTATCVVTVTPKIIAVASISLDKTTASIEAEKTVQLTATVLPDTATVKTVAWTSSAEDVATVVDGLVTAKKVGTATITAKAGSKTATCVVTVTPKIIAVESISLDKTTASIEAEKTMTLVATVSPDTATVKTVAWTSSAEDVATVVEGLVTAKKVGTATITAKAGSATATCVVTVTPKIIAVASISLDKTSISLEELATQKLVASILPTDATDKTIAWTTSAAGVATVVDGLVTAKKAGKATITAQAGSATATCAVIVTAPTAGTITVTGAKELYSVNEEMVVSLDVTMSNGVIKKYTDVNLVSDLNKPEGAIISGFDTSTVGKKSGTITIDSKTSTINYVVYKAVDSEATLRALVESTIDKTPIIIGLTKDITIETQYNVTRPLTLYGVTSEADQNITISTLTASRIFNFDASYAGYEGLANSTIEFHDITMEINNLNGTNLRVNSFHGCGAINVVYDNAVLKTNNYYALNIAALNDKAHFNIKNGSVISGWAAINLWSNNTIIDIDNSTLIGTNNNGGASDDFSIIVVNAANADTNVENNVINVKDSSIIANANTDAFQYCIDLRNESAKVNFSGANSIKTVKKNDTNKTPCYIRGLAPTQIVGIESVKTTDVPALKMFMTRTEVDAVIAGK